MESSTSEKKKCQKKALQEKRILRKKYVSFFNFTVFYKKEFVSSMSKSAAIRTCGEHPNGITINFVTVSSICNRNRCVIESMLRLLLCNEFYAIQGLIKKTLFQACQSQPP